MKINEVINEIDARVSFKGEVVIVLGPPLKKEVSNDELYSALQIALKEYRIKDASAQISEQFGVSRKRTYEMALRIKADLNNLKWIIYKI